MTRFISHFSGFAFGYCFVKAFVCPSMGVFIATFVSAVIMSCCIYKVVEIDKASK